VYHETAAFRLAGLPFQPATQVSQPLRTTSVMPNDLEKFLQQAAERLAQKSNAARGAAAGGQPPRPPAQQRPNRPASPPPLRSQERRAPMAEVLDADIIEAEVISDRRIRDAGDDPFLSIDNRPAMAAHIDQSDERMLEHVRQVFDHDLGQMRPAGEMLADRRSLNQTDQAIEVARRIEATHPLIRMLGSPDSLRAAFIASEIFRRPGT
jgi:hypothetical protein